MKLIGLNKISAILALGGIMAAQANADVAYNSFGEGDTFDIFGRGVSQGSGLAMNFDSATTGAVSLIRLALFPYFYDISINLDDNGLPGTAIETWTNVAGTGLTDVNGDGSAKLSAGGSYWVVVLAHGDNQSGDGEWFDSGSGANGHWAQQAGTGEWHGESSEVCAYRVETQAVPEPASAAALGIGAVVVASRKRRTATIGFAGR